MPYLIALILGMRYSLTFIYLSKPCTAAVGRLSSDLCHGACQYEEAFNLSAALTADLKHTPGFSIITVHLDLSTFLLSKQGQFILQKPKISVLNMLLNVLLGVTALACLIYILAFFLL